MFYVFMDYTLFLTFAVEIWLTPAMLEASRNSLKMSMMALRWGPVGSNDPKGLNGTTCLDLTSVVTVQVFQI